MAFPSSPINGQVANVGGITYIYNSTKTAWTRTPSTGTNLTAFSTTITGTTTSTSTITGALTVAGGVGIQGALYAGNVVATNLTGAITSDQVTTALGFTPISSVPNANTQVTSFGVGTAASGNIGEIRVTKTVGFTSEHDNGSSGASYTIDFNNGQKQRITLTAAPCTLSFTAPTVGIGNFLLKIIQDGSGSRTITWPATVKWPDGVAPTLSTIASAIDIVSLYYDGTNYYSVASLNFS